MKKRITKKKNYMIVILVLGLLFLVITGGLFLPRLFLISSAEKQSDKLEAVSSEYYENYGYAVSKVASLQLSEYEKNRLISGAWASDNVRIASEQSENRAYSVVETAKDILQTLYQRDLYPVDLSQSGANWYTYDAEYYRCKDSTFHTYSTYYWVITLTRYDNTEKHTILMTDDEVILYAEADYLYNTKHILDITVNYKKLPIAENGFCSYTRLDSDITLPAYRNISYPIEMDFVGVLTLGSEWIRDEETLNKYYEKSPDKLEFYYIFQGERAIEKGFSYVIGIIPYEGSNE